MTVVTKDARVPPFNREAEESVLGAMLLSVRAIDVVAELLNEEDFYRDSHAVIFRAVLDLHIKGEPADVLTVVDELEKHGRLAEVGGAGRIMEIAALVPAAANVSHYARIVKEAAMLRGLTRVGAEIADLGWERRGEVTDLLGDAERALFALTEQRVTADFIHVGTLLTESYERISQLQETGGALLGAPTGFRELDKLTLGLQPGNLIVLAARPSLGKTSLALGIAANLVVRQQIPVALFTLEMSRAEITQRLMCSEAHIESQRLRTGQLATIDWQRLTQACETLTNAPLYIDDSGAVTMRELRAKARRLKTRIPDLGLIIVDYLQLMTSGSRAENRVQEVSQISRALKVLGRDLEVPILALSQLSRAVEQRHDKRPMLSDLRESGSIEADADLVFFIYRDEFYNGEESEQQGLAEVILAKHRNGPTDTVKLAFVKRYAKFSDLAAA